MFNLKIKSINNTTKISELSDEMIKLYMSRFYFDRLKRVIRTFNL